MKTSQQRMNLDEYKQIVIRMLDCIHKVCVENHIHYFVAYGTLIGAVRHDGFIPWDDDVDIWMLGEDYERFVQAFSKNDKGYYILSSETSPNYFNIFHRICSKEGILKLKGVTNIENLGPFIDVFPIYKAPEDYDKRMEFYEEIKKANLDVHFSIPFRYYLTNSLKRQLSIARSCLKRFKKRYFVGTKQLKKIRHEIMTKYENTDSDCYYAVYDLTRISDKRVFSRQDIEEAELHKFEDIEVMIPKSYDRILTRIYGDYMTLPPVEKQVSKHHFTPYWR